MATLSELLATKSRNELLQSLLDLLAAEGLPVTDYRPGGVSRTLLEVEAQAQADMSALIPKIAASGYLSLAAGQWLDLYAESAYGLTRNPSVFTRGTLTLTAAAGSGPYDIAVGQLWASTLNGKRFNNTTGGTLEQAGTLELEFRAESPGDTYNVPTSAISELLTPLPGVTITNESTWLLEAGADEETDAALRNRCALRWEEIGQGGTRGAYEFWALSASASVSRVNVLDQNPRGQGTVDVVIWGEGGIGAEVISAVDTYIQARRPITADVNVYAATEVTVNVQATIDVAASRRAQAESEAAANLAQLQQDMPIGGTLYNAAIIEALMAATGVTNVVLVSPAADTALSNVQAVTLTSALTWVEV